MTVVASSHTNHMDFHYLQVGVWYFVPFSQPPCTPILPPFVWCCSFLVCLEAIMMLRMRSRSWMVAAYRICMVFQTSEYNDRWWKSVGYLVCMSGSFCCCWNLKVQLSLAPSIGCAIYEPQIRAQDMAGSSCEWTHKHSCRSQCQVLMLPSISLSMRMNEFLQQQ